MVDTNIMRSFIIWDRQSRDFKNIRDYHLDTKAKREYFKIDGSSLWLENKVALDVFVVQKNGRLEPYHGSILTKLIK